MEQSEINVCNVISAHGGWPDFDSLMEFEKAVFESGGYCVCCYGKSKKINEISIDGVTTIKPRYEQWVKQSD